MTLKATVFIPTFNGETYLRDILNIVFRQRVEFDFEVLIIDSGSHDSTIDIVREFEKKHENLRFLEIPNTEYGHGKTRDEAAHIAKGEIVVYLSHDAIPSHDRWLYEMIRPFEINEKIVGVMGKQIPRPNCFPLLKYEIQTVFGNFGPDFGTTIFYKDDFIKDQGMYDAVSFYSDVNSAGRRSFLIGKFPYKHVTYAEDQVLGRDIIDGGHYKAYAPRGSVVHSNDLALREYKHRMFDETLALRKTGFVVNKPSIKAVVKMTVRGLMKDTVRIMLDKDYSIKRKIYWLIVNPLYYIEKWRGVRLAASTDLKDEAALNKYSLEKRRK